jgi:hypothetical protein
LIVTLRARRFEYVPTHIKMLAVLLVAVAAIILALSLNALMPRGVEAPAPGPGIAPSVSASASASASP